MLKRNKMIIEKVEAGSIPSEDITLNHDYYVIDSETVETLAYLIEAHDLDAVSKTCNDFINNINLLKVNKYESE